MDEQCCKSHKITIGFTVGVWDLFHSGHKSFLERCRGYCDYLVIGVMTDYWVKVQKGSNRPVESDLKRMMDVTSYGDKTILLDTLDMTHYLQMADVWIKSEGQDKMRPYRYDNIVILPRTSGISTTMIINGE